MTNVAFLALARVVREHRRPMCAKCRKPVRHIETRVNDDDNVHAWVMCHGVVEVASLGDMDALQDYFGQDEFNRLADAIPRLMFRGPPRNWAAYTVRPERPEGRVVT